MKNAKLFSLKVVLLVNLAAIVLAGINCSGFTESWKKDQRINSVNYKKIKYLTKGGDTLSIIGYLEQDAMIHTYPCAADWIHFTKDWRLKLFRITEETVINHFTYPKDTWIMFSETGNVICVFPKSMTVQGYICKGGGGSKGIQTSFYPNGRLYSFFSQNDFFVQNIYCNGGVFSITKLYENGNLKECTLAKKTEINGIEYGKNTKIVFAEDGSVHKK